MYIVFDEIYLEILARYDVMIMTMVAIIDEQYSSEFPHNFEQMYSKTSSLASAIYTQN